MLVRLGVHEQVFEYAEALVRREGAHGRQSAPWSCPSGKAAQAAHGEYEVLGFLLSYMFL